MGTTRLDFVGQVVRDHAEHNGKGEGAEQEDDVDEDEGGRRVLRQHVHACVAIKILRRLCRLARYLAQAMLPASLASLLTALLASRLPCTSMLSYTICDIFATGCYQRTNK